MKVLLTFWLTIFVWLGVTTHGYETCTLTPEYEACISEIKQEYKSKLNGIDVNWFHIDFGEDFCASVGKATGCSDCVKKTVLWLARMD